MHPHKHTRIHVHTHVYIHAHTYTGHAHTNICIHVHMHVYTHTHCAQMTSITGVPFHTDPSFSFLCWFLNFLSSSFSRLILSNFNKSSQVWWVAHAHGQYSGGQAGRLHVQGQLGLHPWQDSHLHLRKRKIWTQEIKSACWAGTRSSVQNLSTQGKSECVTVVPAWGTGAAGKWEKS